MFHYVYKMFLLPITVKSVAQFRYCHVTNRNNSDIIRNESDDKCCVFLYHFLALNKAMQLLCKISVSKRQCLVQIGDLIVM